MAVRKLVILICSLIDDGKFIATPFKKSSLLTFIVFFAPFFDKGFK
jgi:hypothetical protein